MAEHIGWISRRKIIVVFWLATIFGLVVMAHTGAVAWDAQIYWKAGRTLRQGSDPYAVGIAAMRAFQNRSVSSPPEHAPFIYSYSPMTLPLLRLPAALPGWLLGLLYGLAVSAGALLELWAGFQMADEGERPWLAVALPAVIFFPGLITDDVILSGNISYVLYGAILTAAVPGWKRGRWFWYYVAVPAASLFKAPFLTLLAFPILVGKRQWFPACITAGAGLLLFASQARLWPELFREYLLAVRFLFDGNHDFGFGPAGVFGTALWHWGLSYSPATTILYLLSASVVGTVLLMLARRARLGKFSREEWIPVALVGTLLLNPKIMKYDLAAFTVPMLLIGWRILRNAPEHFSGGRPHTLPSFTGMAAVAVICFVAANAVTVSGPDWVPVELITLLAIFTLGISSLLSCIPKGQLVVTTSSHGGLHHEDRLEKIPS
jgi:hypothetical protein